MTAAAKVDRLGRAVSSLEAALKANELVPSNSRKSISPDRERVACAEIREIVVTNNFTSVYKEDHRYGDVFNKAIETIFKALNHPNQGMRSFADESLDAILRSLLLARNHSRVLVVLITELGRNGPARSLVAAIGKLAQLIHLSKCNQRTRYAVYIINALAIILKRPEDSIQQAIILYAEVLFNTIGSRLKNQHREKIFELYRVALGNLELSVSSNRAAVVIIKNICSYYPSVLSNALVHCMVNIREMNEKEHINQLIGSLNTLKSIWSLVAQSEDNFPDILRTVLCRVLCCSYSLRSEVVIPAVELIERMMHTPLKLFSTFCPGVFDMKASLNSYLTSTDRTLPSDFSVLVNEVAPLSSPSGSVFDTSSTDCELSNFNVSRELADMEESDGDSKTKVYPYDEIIDPLMHADLYEKVSKNFSAEGSELTEQFPKKSTDYTIDIPQQLPTGICDSSANFYLYTATMLGKRFLLSGLKGLKNDRDVRISHKILALNCLTSIAKVYDLSKAVVYFGEMEQSLLEVSRFILHDDDMLCSSTISFLFTVDKYRIGYQGNAQNYRRVMNAFQPIRKRALLQAAIGQQHVLEGLGLLSDTLELSTIVQSTFFLFKVTCAEFISSLRWSSIQKSIKEKWQEKCLNGYFILLFEEDQKVSQAALSGFPKLIRNADFTDHSSIFVMHELSDPFSLDQDPLPAVLNLPSEYRFLNESPNLAIGSNLEVILNLMLDYATMDLNRRSAGLCSAIEVLLNAFPAAVYSDCWGNINRTSISFGLLSLVVDLCELNLNSPLQLSTGINVIAKLFGGLCESSMVNAKLENKMHRMTLPRLPDSVLLDRLMLIPLRVLNMYYSLIAEYRSTASQSTSSLLSRPTLSPLPSKKTSSSRVADISRLLGTNIHPHKTTSFLECPVIKYIFPSIQGAHKNYMENLGLDRELKFLSLLTSALNCLGTICEMMTFIQLKPLLEEIILYVKVTFDVCPEGCCRLVHQLFKVVFGKNTANINLDVLQSMNINGDTEILEYRYMNEFAKFSSFINRKEYIDIIVHRRLGWLKMDMLSKVHSPPQNEIAPALELFEGIVNTLLHVYGAFQSIECKQAILRVMCELLRGGIIYTMADPKKILFEAVMVQLHDPSSGNKELLREIALYMIILARNNVVTFDKVLYVAIELLNHIDNNNAIEVLQAVEVIVLEMLYVQHLELGSVYNAFRSNANNLFAWASQQTLLLWVLFLHDARIEERRWSSVSLDFFNDYSEYLVAYQDCFLDFSVYLAITSLSCMSPSLYRPIYIIFKLLERFVEDKGSSIQTKLKRTVPLWFVLINNVAEEKLLMRLEQIHSMPLEWISRCLESILSEGMSLATNDIYESAHNFLLALLQILENTVKSDNYPKLASILKTRLSSINIYSAGLAYFHPVLLFQWIQLMSYCEDGPLKVDIFLDQYAFKHGRQLYLLSPLNHDISSQVDFDILQDKITNEYIMKKLRFPDFVKTAFLNHNVYSNPDVYYSLLHLDSQDLYYVYDCVAVEQRQCFLNYLLRAVIHHIKVRMVDMESYKAALVKSQEIVDVIYELIEYEEEDSCNSLLLKASILAEMDFLISHHHLQWPEFRPNEVLSLLEFTAIQMNTWMPHLNELFHGTMFMLRHPSVKDLFSKEPFHFLPQLQNVIAGIVKLLETETSVKCESTSSVENFFLIIDDEHEFGEFHGGCEGFLRVLFDRIQYICNIFRSQCDYQASPLQKFVTVLFRHPILNAFAIIPYTALKMNWKLRVEIRGNTVHVPLINIHMLCNLDILNDFTWRLNWLGWTSRQQFEDFWMSLFGVLSSTPTGSEITSHESDNIYEQILSSSVAVSVLTDILLHSLLYPEPGNPPFGKFLIKHRERTEPFYHSKSMQQLCRLHAELTGDMDPPKAYRRNIERLSYNGVCYGLGQLSALSLWTLTGVLSTESSRKSPFLETPLSHLSLSDFLLKSTSELDTASLVRALFENYSHWFSRGLDFLPLPLLSATVRSMTLLSDLFDESASYEFLYIQMKNVFRGGYLMDHPDIGYVIYALLKSVTVVGLESVDRSISEMDLAKQILTWVETGLTSRSPFVREATLHGFSYILQSMSFDSLKPVFQYVNGFLLVETSKQLSILDHINITEIPASLEYANLLWSISFRVMEEPLQVSFKNSLIQKLCDAFVVMNFSHPLLSTVTSGIESLILHSSTYIEQFLPIVLSCLKEYAAMNFTLVFALRILIVCVFREDSDSRKDSAINFEPFLNEIYNIYRKCELRDASMIASVLPSLLHRLFTEEYVLNILLDLCAPVKGTYLQNISHSLRMMFEFCERLRESQRLSILSEFSQVVLSNVKSVSVSSRDTRAVGTCLLVSTSTIGDVAYRFPFYLDALHSSDSFENAFEWALFVTSEEKNL